MAMLKKNTGSGSEVIKMYADRTVRLERQQFSY